MENHEKEKSAHYIFYSSDIETDGAEYSIEFEISLVSESFESSILFKDDNFIVTKLKLIHEDDFTSLNELKNIIHNHVQTNFDISSLYDKIGEAIAECSEGLVKWV